MAPVPYVNAVALTYSDTTVYEPCLQAIMMLTAGNLTLVLQGGQTLVLTAPAVNTIYPFKIRKVMAASTGTAVGLS